MGHRVPCILDQVAGVLTQGVTSLILSANQDRQKDAALEKPAPNAVTRSGCGIALEVTKLGRQEVLLMSHAKPASMRKRRGPASAPLACWRLRVGRPLRHSCETHQEILAVLMPPDVH